MVAIEKADLSVNLNGLELKNPILTASGTFGFGDEFEDFVDVKKLGAVVTKAVTLLPREGNKTNRLIEVKSGIINSIGLENLGAERFFEEKVPMMKEKNIEFIMNMAGADENEYVELAKMSEQNDLKAIELNVSCPNVKSGCLEFGTDEKTLENLVKRVRNEFSGTLIVKLTPNVTSIEKIGIAAQKAGADIISAINTVKGLGLKLTFSNGKFQKEMVTGGFSGEAIKPIALGAVFRLSKTVDIPIIGMGGISKLQDVLEFFTVGADAIQIGTANFTHPDISESIIADLQSFMSKNGFKNIKELKTNLKGAINE
ncbi:MAG: dihydroorotate dehydrogenase [Candidatus Gastranaerophilales bacterium]|nr:dihydroorotate dehydrogenase [Candidatus Gastranaerophilales bacterium]